MQLSSEWAENAVKQFLIYFVLQKPFRSSFALWRVTEDPLPTIAFNQWLTKGQ